MPTRILPLALVGLLLALAPTVAQAKQPTIAQAIHIADQAFPWSPCAGHLYVIPDNTLLPAGLEGEVDTSDGTCGLHIAPGLGDRRCDVIVHEAGHRTGLGHTARGVMAPSGGVWPACHPVMPLRRQYRNALLGILPTPARSWRVTCAKLKRVTPCRAARTGSRVRRYHVELRHRSFLVRERGGNWSSFELGEGAS